MTRIIGNKWSFDGVGAMDTTPTALCLTTYAGESEDVMRMPFQQLIEQVEAGTLHLQIGKTSQLNQIVGAHRWMEENKGREQSWRKDRVPLTLCRTLWD